MPKALVNRMAQFALAVAVLALVGVGIVSYRGLVLSGESEQWVRHTYEVLGGLDGLLAATQSVESSSRGFALTGAESYLATFQAAVGSARKETARIRLAVADNPEQQSHLAELGQLVEQKIRFGEQVLELRRTGGLEAAATVIATGAGQRLMQELEAVVGTLRDEEWRLLALRNAAAQRRLQQAKAVLIFGDLVGLLVVVGAFASVHRDSLRRRAVEEELRESEEKYRMLLDGVRDYAIFMMDPQGDVLSWNAGAERTKGYAAGEILGRNFTCFFTPDDVRRGRPEELLRTTAASGRQEEQALRVRRDGSQFLAHVTLAALYDRSGKLRGFSEISHDLSQSKESEARYRGLLEAAPDAMVVVDTGGEIVLLNVQAEKQFGYRRDELVGQPVKNIIPEGFAERLVADALRSTEEALAQRIGTGIELSGRRKNGTEFPIEIMLSPLEGAEGMLVTAAIRDISTRKAAEAQLLQKVEELKRSNEELGQFAYIASHDLQEPLRMVASYTQLLSRRYKGRLDSDADEFIAFAVDGASRMQRLIQDLLAFSRVGTKGKELCETSSQRALEQALVNLRGAIEDSGALVTHDPLPSVLADETQLVQLFQNLVGNAIKYQGPGVPRVHVSAIQQDGPNDGRSEIRNGGRRWLFSVRDNGLGIDPKYFERIFGMFQRLHKREEFAGTGIGLAICRKIAERHGSPITVESQPGQGSTFRFALVEAAESSELR